MMKTLLLSALLAFGIFDHHEHSEASVTYISDEHAFDDRSPDSVVRYHVRVKATKKKHQPIIDDQFKELLNLELHPAKIYYNETAVIKYDCEIEIIFSDLTVKEKEYSQNKHFSKVVSGEQTLAENDDGPMVYSETVRGFVYQRIKERKLNWDIIIKNNFTSNNFDFPERSYTETIVSKTTNNSISGDERAISKKYKEAIGKPLLSRSDMEELAIANVYSKIAYQLKRNN